MALVRTCRPAWLAGTARTGAAVSYASYAASSTPERRKWSVGGARMARAVSRYRRSFERPDAA